jgi:DNA-binding NtrC family response regulator
MVSPTPRLLFVDDEESIRFALRDYFAAEGYEVDVAPDVDQAAALLAGRPYDVVVIDLRLGPRLEPLGLELVSRVRTQYPATKVVLFTAHGSPEIAQASGGLGATFLEKPLPLQLLRSVIEGLRRVNPPDVT